MDALLSQLQAIESDPTKLRGESFARAAEAVAKAIVKAEPLGPPPARRFPSIPYTLRMRSNDGDSSKDFIVTTESVSLLEACRELQAEHPGFTAVL